MPTVSMRDVAGYCGVSEMTVSRALRNQGRISQATRERILATAKELGYRPDPKIREYLSYVRETRGIRAHEVLALIWIDATPFDVYDPVSPVSARLKRIVQGAHQRADELGYRLEEFWFSAPALSSRRLAQILAARGITGVVVGPRIRLERKHLELEWLSLATVVIDNADDLPSLDRVQVDNYGLIPAIFTRLKKLGYRRVGLCLDSQADLLCHHNVKASFLVNHPLGMEKALSLLHVHGPRRLNFEEYRDWWADARPEIALHQERLPEGWERRMHDSGFCDFRHALLDLSSADRHEGQAGARIPHELLGANAIDLVASRRQRNDHGPPSHPKSIYIDARWEPGARLQPLASHSVAEPFHELAAL